MPMGPQPPSLPLPRPNQTSLTMPSRGRSGTLSSHERACYKAGDPESRYTQITQLCTAAVNRVGNKSLRQIECLFVSRGSVGLFHGL